MQIACSFLLPLRAVGVIAPSRFFRLLVLLVYALRHSFHQDVQDEISQLYALITAQRCLVRVLRSDAREIDFSTVSRPRGLWASMRHPILPGEQSRASTQRVCGSIF